MNDITYSFASSNSMNGFCSYFNSVFDCDKLERIYIIKGGPGTGKSSMIKSVGENCKNKGGEEYFLCSSDRRSVDGLIIGGKVAIIDGTAPHTTDARYPGVTEYIINNADAISGDISENKKYIKELMDEKKNLYRTAYAYLKAAGELKQEHCKYLATALNKDKLEGAVSRLFKQCFKNGNSTEETIRLTCGITPDGIYNTGSFEEKSKTKCLIVNGKGYENLIYDSIYNKAKEYGHKLTKSYDPLIPYSFNALKLDNMSACFVNYSKELHGEADYDKYKVINCERFFDKGMLEPLKPKLKFAEKYTAILVNEAVKSLHEASKVHKELERIYSKYTDYEKIDLKTEKIIVAIQSIF